nr:MAG TPA: hypothetical protein [Caudoviricetes sp.]
MKNSKNLKLNIEKTIAEVAYKIDLTKHEFSLDIDKEKVWYVPFNYDLLLPDEVLEYAEKEIIKLYNNYIEKNNLLDLPEEERELVLDEYRIRELDDDCEHIYEKINSMLEKEMKELGEDDLDYFFEEMKDDEDDWKRFLDSMETDRNGYIYHLIVTIWEHPYNLVKSLRIHEYHSGNPERNETDFGEVRVYFDMEEEK